MSFPKGGIYNVVNGEKGENNYTYFFQLFRGLLVSKFSIFAKLNEIKETSLFKITQLNQISKEQFLCIKCFSNIKINTNPNNFKNTIDYYITECGEYICSNCIDNEIYNNKVEEDHNKIKVKCLTCKNTNIKGNQIDAFITGFHTIETLKITSMAAEKENQLNNTNKLVILNKILHIVGNKTIIFSQYRGASTIIKQLASVMNFKYVELDGGNIKDLNKIFDDFKNDKSIKLLLIDDASFGVGINIEYATDILFFNKTESKLKEQIIGRAQRFGRTCSLCIWEIYYKYEL